MTSVRNAGLLNHHPSELTDRHVTRSVSSTHSPRGTIVREKRTLQRLRSGLRYAVRETQASVRGVTNTSSRYTSTVTFDSSVRRTTLSSRRFRRNVLCVTARSMGRRDRRVNRSVASRHRDSQNLSELPQPNRVEAPRRAAVVSQPRTGRPRTRAAVRRYRQYRLWLSLP